MTVALPTGRPGRMLALGVTVLGVALLWLGVIAPLWDWYDDRGEQLHRQQAVVRKMSALVDSLPALRREAAATPKEGDGGRPALLTGATDALAAASLQQRIDDVAAQAGVRMESEEILAAKPAGSLRAISVRMTMNAPFAALVELLTALANADIPMVVDDVTIRAGFREAGAASSTNAVDTSFTVTSWRAAGGDAR